MMTENFPNLMKTINPQIQTKNMKKTIQRHILIKLLKNSDKDKNIKSSQRKTRPTV